MTIWDMIKWRTAAVLVAGASLSSLWSFAVAEIAAEPVVSASKQAAKNVLIRNVSVEDGVVSGVIVNNTGHELRNVKLLIRYDWLWENERSPGHDSPDRAIVHTVPEVIPPGGQVPFTYDPKWPLPERSDGRFLPPSVVVVGFTQFR